jgi:hypothetical protein
VTSRRIRAVLARLAVLGAAALLSTVPARAGELAREHVSAKAAADGTCVDARRTGAAVANRRLTASRSGYLTARLDGRARGDWDLAVYRRGLRAPVAASAYRGSREVASGFVKRGDRLTVRTCGGRGAAPRASVSIERVRDGRARIVRITTPTRSSRTRLARLGLDLTENAGSRYVDAVLHGRDDARALRRAGLRFATPPRPEAADPATAGALPSGVRTVYRRLPQYSAEMKTLATNNPDLVKPFTLAHESVLGRPVEGLEVTENASARDGKPVLLMLGLHHAREWPSGEHTLEWAYELVNDYRAGDATTRSLLARARVIIVPVVNPDGFNFSREDGEARGHAGGSNDFNGTQAEFHRKNCRPSCAISGGVDLNRNYGDRWGGEGGTESPAAETYRGTAPFSEPEVQNVRELISQHQVVTMITNHTFGNEVLRQPGAQDDFPTPDEAVYKQLGDDIAAEAGYGSIASYELYAPNDHVGTTDGWSYFTTGGLGFVVESMPSAFHPPYAQVVTHYETGSGGGGTGEGLRGAFFLALESTADPTRHSIVSGSAPPGAILRLTKTFTNRTDIGPFTDERFDTTMEVPSSGQFEWHVNASGRPLFPAETWTLTCESPEGTVLTTQQVPVARGATAAAGDLTSACTPAGPPEEPPPVEKPQPDLTAKLTARTRKHSYRARVSGALTGIDRGPGARNCAGKVQIELRARGKRLARRGSVIDSTCGYERGFKVKRGKRTAKKMRAIVRWAGNEYLAAAETRVSVRVRRPAR